MSTALIERGNELEETQCDPRASDPPMIPQSDYTSANENPMEANYIVRATLLYYKTYKSKRERERDQGAFRSILKKLREQNISGLRSVLRSRVDFPSSPDGLPIFKHLLRVRRVDSRCMEERKRWRRRKRSKRRKEVYRGKGSKGRERRGQAGKRVVVGRTGQGVAGHTPRVEEHPS